MRFFKFKRNRIYRLSIARFLQRLAILCLRLLILLAIAGALGAIGWTGWKFHHFLLRSDYFSVRDVRIDDLSADKEVEGLIRSKIDEAQITGQNLLLVKEEAIRKDLESIPKVRKATVRKQYPCRISISASLREIAVLLIHDPILAIDKEGVVIDTLSTQSPKMLQYPLITGLQVGSMELGKQMASEILTRALLLVSSLESREPSLFKRMSEVHCDNENNLTLLLKGGTEIRFGTGNPVERMPNLDTFLEQLGPAERYAYIDLRFEGQVPCRAKQDNAEKPVHPDANMLDTPMPRR